MRSAPSIGFEYRPSRWPCVALAALGALAVTAIFLSDVSMPLACALTAWVTAYAVWACRRTMKRVVHRVTWRADGGWSLGLQTDEDVPARLIGSRVLAGVTILRLAWATQRPAALILLPDNLDADTCRRLRMRLSGQADTL